jgi:alpha-tubulin suppressor-like RCC1 family protein
MHRTGDKNAGPVSWSVPSGTFYLLNREDGDMNNKSRYSILTLPAALMLVILCMAGISWGATPQLAAGDFHTVMLRSDGSLWASGNNAFGQLGDGTLTSRNSPVQIGTARNWTAVAAGADHTLALKADGTLWAWGRNSFGQLGKTVNGLPTGAPVASQSVPVQIGTDRNWVSVAADGSSSFALKGDGTLWAWGRNDAGQLGNGDPAPLPADVAMPVLAANPGGSRYVAVSAGGRHTLALQADGTLWAWGDNRLGQLGQGQADQSPHATPLRVGLASDWTAVSAGGLHSLALKGDGTLWGWGDNQFGQTGHEPADLTPRATPLQVGTDRDWAALSAGDLHSMAIKRSGTLWAWGDNTAGQLGDGTTVQRNTPVQIVAPASLADIVAVAAGAAHSLALRANGELHAWGDNGSGQLGNGTTIGALSPLHSATDAAGWTGTDQGGAFTVALRSNGTLWAWGDNASGQLGDGTLTQRPVPAMVGTAANWSARAAGWSHTAALRADGSLWTWGNNASGQLGDGTTVNRQAPLQITVTQPASAQNSWRAVAAGDFHTLALQADGTLWVWGNNTNGQLGDGTTTQRSVPVRVVTGNPGNFDRNWTAISAGGTHSLALQADGTLWAWGDNRSGQLGVPILGAGSSVPRQIVSFAPPATGWNSSWKAIAAGLSHSLALQADGTLWGWGSNFSGQLGNGDATLPNPPDQTVPVQVVNPGAAPYTAVAAGDSFSVALQADGTLWSWGNNTRGQLGNGASDPDPLHPVPHPTPVRESTAAANWVAAGSGSSHTMALKADGNLWGWGNNAAGQLGDGTTANRNIPAPFSGSATAINVTPAALSFGAVAIGTASSRTITIGNTGTGPLAVSALGLGGADGAMFSVTAGTCGPAPFSVAAGGSCTVLAAFNPALPAGAKSATLTIASNDPLFPTTTVDLSGGAVVPFTVTASVSGGSPAGSGTITPQGTMPALPGATPTFAIMPGTGYHTVDVTVNGVSQGAVTSLTLPPLTANVTVVAFFDINTYTITATAGAGGTIFGPAAAIHGDMPTYTITPNTGYHVVDVTVNGVSRGAVTALTLPPVTGNVTITATFAANIFTITAAAGANGSITGPATATFGSTPTYTIAPNTGYHVADVTVNGSSKGAVTTLTLPPLAGNVTIIATFAINTYTITMTAGAGGTITGPATVNHGDTPTYAITPNTGYHVAVVAVDGVSKGAVTTVTLPPVTANATIAATFAINIYTITAAGDARGSISPSGSVTVAYGTNQTFSFAPNPGYSVVKVLVDGVSQGPLSSYTFTNVTGDGHTIRVIFIPEGDVNNDGKVDIADALRVLRISVGLETPTATDLLQGDVAPLDAAGIPLPDKKLTVGDALVILRKAVGLITW